MQTTQYSQLFNNVNLAPQFPYIVNCYIREYDLQKANISVLRSLDIIDEETYLRLYHSDRMYRQIFIGNMIRDDKEIGYALKRGLIHAKQGLFELNAIQDHEVLCIKNDAIFVVNKELATTTVGRNLNFICKNVYTIFMKLCNLEIYYADKFLPDGQLSINVDVKGISDELLPLHQGGMLDLICTTCNMLQRFKSSEIISYLMEMYDLFIQRKLPNDYYREFNESSHFAFRSKYSTFYMDMISDEYRNAVDINRNLTIIRDLISIVSNLYTADSRRG